MPTNRDYLKPGELAFKYGKTLANNSISVTIDATPLDGQAITNAKLSIVIDLDAEYLFSPKTINVPPTTEPGYQVNYDEIGYPGNKSELFNGGVNTELYVSFFGSQAYLNVKIPIADPIKRDSISIIDEAD